MTPNEDLNWLFNDILFDIKVKEFAIESNKIENIHDEKSHNIHFNNLSRFLKLEKLSIKNIESFVNKIAPHAKLRQYDNQNVRIANHIAPIASKMLPLLKDLIKEINKNSIDPWSAHVQYEHLHPFLDGNGRSGRAIWLWQMVRFNGWMFIRGFKHHFYYQTLDKMHSMINTVNKDEVANKTQK